MRRNVAAIAIIVAALTVAATAQAKYYVPKKGHVCKTHYKSETIKIRERKHGKLVRRHHKVVMIKQVRCVYVAPKKTIKPPAQTVAPVNTPAPPAAPNVRAGIDPSFTQDSSDNLKVTWTYGASAPVPLPNGTLSLAVTEPSKAGSSGGCSINVGGDTAGGNCTQELPHYGSWNVTVSYVSSDPTVAPATSTDTEDIEPLPATVTKTWGTDAPSNAPTATATVIGNAAHVQVNDANYEGASSLLVSDQNGDSCTATIGGNTATCQMPVGATPTRFLVAYPGGTSTQTTQTVAPDGTQRVTTNWPAQQIAVTNPIVTVQQATIEECGGSQQGGPVWNNPTGTCSFGNPGTWSNPVETTTNRQVQLDAVAYGSLNPDRDPTHGDGQVSGFLTFNVTGGTEGTDYTASDFQNGPDNSTDCSEVTTQSFDAGTGTSGPDEPTGTCALKFLTTGTYTVAVSYHSEDANYADSTMAPSETIDVLP
jgi:hypothetical protein